MVYLSLPHLYLEWFKIKWTKHPLSSINAKELFIQAIKSIQGEKSAVKYFVLLTQIYLCHSQDDQMIIFTCCLLMYL